MLDILVRLEGGDWGDWGDKSSWYDHDWSLEVKLLFLFILFLFVKLFLLFGGD